MKMSTLFSRTLRESPASTDSKGHEYLIRAGYIKQTAAGIYSALPLGFKSLKKIEQIIREEMDAIGAMEIQMPVVNPAEIWKETGRYFSIDAELSRFKDRYGRDMVLAMTHEEAVTDIMRDQIQTYRQLPFTVYQIQTKWRDDPRPRAGLIRVREFTMKDSYSFHRDQDSLNETYQDHYHAYFNIYKRCGLDNVIAVEADMGIMGGKLSHEYMYLNPLGEDTIVFCSKCEYKANKQVAAFHKQLHPADPLPMEEIATPETKTIEELCSFLNIEPRQTAKAVFMIGTFPSEDNPEETFTKLVTGIVRGDMDVEENKLQIAAGALSLRPAQDEEITACGMVPGYASPVGAENTLVIVDDSVAGSNNLVAGANKSGYHMKNTNFTRDYSGIIADIAAAADGFACPECKSPLKSGRGIEVGNIFQLGIRYSEALGCTYQDENGKGQPVVMGSYGIGVGRLLACIAEEYHDDKGLTLPPGIAPFDIHIVNLLKTSEEGDTLYRTLKAHTTAAGKSMDVLYDDRKESPGVKFNDADLIGAPLRITLGNRAMKEGCVEFTVRKTGKQELIPLDTVIKKVEVFFSTR